MASGARSACSICLRFAIWMELLQAFWPVGRKAYTLLSMQHHEVWNIVRLRQACGALGPKFAHVCLFAAAGSV